MSSSLKEEIPNFLIALLKWLYVKKRQPSISPNMLYGTLCSGDQLNVETRLNGGGSLEIVDCSEYQPIVFQDCEQQGDMVRDFTQDIQNPVPWMLMLLNPYWSFSCIKTSPVLVPISQSNSICNPNCWNDHCAPT